VIVDEIEPLPDRATDYRSAALDHLKALSAIDLRLSTATDARLAWVTVAMVFNLTSCRNCTLPAIAKAIGVSESRLARSKAKFVKLVGPCARALY